MSDNLAEALPAQLSGAGDLGRMEPEVWGQEPVL